MVELVGGGLSVCEDLQDGRNQEWGDRLGSYSHFNFQRLFRLNIDKTDYISYLMNLFNKFEVRK